MEDPPVRFIRSASALPLPVPERGGDINELKAFLNVRDLDSFILAARYIIARLQPSGPYPILVLTGTEGSAKSTFTRIVRGLIDPNRAPIRALPRDEANLSAQTTLTCLPMTASRRWPIGNRTRSAGSLPAALMPARIIQRQRRNHH